MDPGVAPGGPHGTSSGAPEIVEPPTVGIVHGAPTVDSGIAEGAAGGSRAQPGRGPGDPVDRRPGGSL